MEPPVQLSEPFTVRVPVPPMVPPDRFSVPEEPTLAPVFTFTVAVMATPPEPAPDREAPEPRVQALPSNDRVPVDAEGVASLSRTTWMAVVPVPPVLRRVPVLCRGKNVPPQAEVMPASEE